MGENEIKFGNLNISPDVIIGIIKKEIREQKGVCLVDSFGENITGRIKRNKIRKKGVSLDYRDEGLVIELRIGINKGLELEKMAEKAQKKVKRQVEAISGIKINRLDIIVEKINT